MSLVATLAAEDVAHALGCSTTEALELLLGSKTGEDLYDDSLKLWWESPRDLAVAYLQECGKPIPADWMSRK